MKKKNEKQTAFYNSFKGIDYVLDAVPAKQAFGTASSTRLQNEFIQVFIKF